jgi:sarcosine oxidase subunit gamma
VADATVLHPRSAFDGLLTAGRGGREDGEPGVRFAERTGLALAGVVARRGKIAELEAAAERAFGIALPATPRRVPGIGVEMSWSGPRQWLLLADEAVVPDLASRLAAAFEGLASVTDQSDARAIVRISGPRVHDLLAKGCPVDLHPTEFGPGHTAVTAIAHIGVQLWQTDERPTFEVAVARSYAPSFWRFLTASAGEFGYVVEAPIVER